MPKPVKKKKKFIHKKEATTYRLIPGYVEDDEETSPATCSTEELESRKEEQRKHGIYFDDAYNYLKHLRSVNEQATLVSTESYQIAREQDEVRSIASGPPLFMEYFSTDATEEEEIDPELLSALENAPAVNLDDVEETELLEDFLDDDFITKAGGVLPTEDDNVSDREDDFQSDEDEDECSDLDESEDEEDESDDLSDDEQEQHGRGTVQDDIIAAQTALILRNFEEGYGFRCSNQISDDEPEQVTAEDYENLKHILKQDKLTQEPVSWSEVLDDKSEKPKVDTSKYLYDDVDEYEWKEVAPSKPKFDCVSILSLNSNTRNLPTDLLPPRTEGKKKSSKSVADSDTSNGQGLTLKQLDAEIRENRKADKASTFRPQDETIEEKKARKKAIKDERRERRQEKKANKQVFAMEHEKLQRETAALSKSVKSVKIC
ncbi:protein LTV1 homolog [Physella acuta]|uniref:protein LTV1 homolog n=1 Tax=Physella acuta TaxID=109671 RepID=UPI0027DBD5B2|nr:protein LTV1 homolog [Physella acuta]